MKRLSVSRHEEPPVTHPLKHPNDLLQLERDLVHSWYASTLHFAYTSPLRKPCSAPHTAQLFHFLVACPRYPCACDLSPCFRAFHTGDQYGLGTVRTLQSFADRVDVDFCAATITSPDARNGGLLATDFNDSVASGLEGLLGILKAEMGRKSGFGGKCEDDESVDDHVIDDGGDDGGV